MQTLTSDQVRRLLAVAKLDKVERWAALFAVAITTGMRPSEYLALKWPDLALERRIVSVQRSIDFLPDGKREFADNKTGRSRRTIKLRSDVAEMLREHRASQEQTRQEAENWVDTDLVFSTRVGTPIGRINVRRALRRLIALANNSIEDSRLKIPRIRLYDLRHTAATLALAAGVSIKVVQEMLGHASAALTLNVYSHVLPHMQDEAADLVEALLRGPVSLPANGTTENERGPRNVRINQREKKVMVV